MTHVIYGRKSIPGVVVFDAIDLASSSLPGFRILGASAVDQSGYSVSAAGDCNGDGIDDVLVGTALGSSYVIYGTPADPTSQPSSQPSRQPAPQPTSQPSWQPSLQPSIQPSSQPSRQPSIQPSRQPVGAPTAQPSSQPSRKPSGQPSRQPTIQPSAQPSLQPTAQPNAQPTGIPTAQPSIMPSVQPSTQPSHQPTLSPTAQPSGNPTGQPTSQPSNQPSIQPSCQPSIQQSLQPSTRPSSQPSEQPTTKPSSQPYSAPSTQPSAQPSTQPSNQPRTPPSAQPSVQPSGTPTKEPTTQPSALPSARPSSYPSSYPSSQPSAQPSAQSVMLPSTQPSSQPTSQPSALPSLQPSTQPSAQPTLNPSTIPTLQPTTRPSAQPNRIPSSQPTDAPSSQPSLEPSPQITCLPSSQPSCQPSMQPSTQPTMPSPTISTVYPTAEPFRNSYVAMVDDVQNINIISTVQNALWACGKHGAKSLCAVLNTETGSTITSYAFTWNESTSVLQTSNFSHVYISGRSELQNSPIVSHVVQCGFLLTQRTCSGSSVPGSSISAGSFAPFPNKMVFIGTYSTYTSAIIIDVLSGLTKCFTYSYNTLKSIALQHVESPPSYVGVFVAGSGVSISGAINYIVAGIVRTDSGSLTAMYLAPISGSILNSAELVNAMALEYEHPDTFIAGGLELNDGAGMHAYVMRVNVFFGSVRYVIRYRIEDPNIRRVLSDEPSIRSVTRGMVRIDTALYVVVDFSRNVNNNDFNYTRVTILKVDMQTGEILQEVHLSSPNASLSCTDVTTSASGSFIYIACSITFNASSSEDVVIATDLQLPYAKLPEGFTSQQMDLFQAESVPFKRTSFGIMTKTTPIVTERFLSSFADGKSTSQPSRNPTLTPSWQPSHIPSSQPSSSPTAAPSVSPQPTSQPSSSSPTNTYKPTVKPTPRPSAAPSEEPTKMPSANPSTTPTVQPTAKPSTYPTGKPSVTTTAAPSRIPTIKPTMKPITVPSAQPTLAPSLAGSSVVPQVATSKSGQSSTKAALIFLFVVAGLIGTWCSYRLLKYCMQARYDKEKRKILRAQLDAIPPTAAVADDPALQGPHLPVPRKHRRAKPDDVPAGAHVDESARDDHPDSISVGAYANSAPIGAYANTAPVGAYANSAPPPKDENEYASDASIDDMSVGENAYNARTAAAPVGAFATGGPVTANSNSSFDSSSVVLSSLHSSEMSDVSYSVFSDEHHNNELIVHSHRDDAEDRESAMEEGKSQSSDSNYNSEREAVRNHYTVENNRSGAELRMSRSGKTNYSGRN